MWGITLSGPLPVVGLVRRYRTNYLMGRSLLQERVTPFLSGLCSLGAYAVLALLSERYPALLGR